MDDDIDHDFSCTAKDFCADFDQCRDLLNRLCQLANLTNHCVSLSIVDSSQIQELNKQFRGIDRATDVLAFPQKTFSQPLNIDKETCTSPTTAATKSQPPEILGDIVICPTIAEENAKNIGQSLDRELVFLLVHGFLHLIGYDHQNPEEEEQMTSNQRFIMEALPSSSIGNRLRNEPGPSHEAQPC